MSSRLQKVLETNRREIESALAESEGELEQLRQRCRELELLIVRARAALGSPEADTPARPASATGEGGLTLHGAMAFTLMEHGNEPMTARQLADSINQNGLYKKRDGSPIDINQIHARALNYQDQFEKVGSRIRLRREQYVSTLTQALA